MRHQVGMLAGIRLTCVKLRQAYGDCILSLVTSASILQGLAGDPEQPGASLGEVERRILEATPRHEHHLAYDVFGVGVVHAPAHEQEQVDVRRVIQLAEAVFSSPRWRRRSHT